MSNSQQRARAGRRERRKAKASGWRREPKGNPKKVGHGSNASRGWVGYENYRAEEFDPDEPIRRPMKGPALANGVRDWMEKNTPAFEGDEMRYAQRLLDKDGVVTYHDPRGEILARVLPGDLCPSYWEIMGPEGSESFSPSMAAAVIECEYRLNDAGWTVLT